MAIHLRSAEELEKMHRAPGLSCMRSLTALRDMVQAGADDDGPREVCRRKRSPGWPRQGGVQGIPRLSLFAGALR